MITALVGLAWIWWALLGLGATFMGFWALGSICYQPTEIEIKNRDRWLRQHFGEDGRKRWLENKRKNFRYAEFCDQHKIRRLPDIEQWAVIRKFVNEKLGGYPRRTADGRCEGFVELPLSDYKFNAPWGNDCSPYIERHPDTVDWFWRDGCCGARSHHGEPRTADWLAAGFWDPVRRADDGVLVDPIEVVLYREVKGDIWKSGSYGRYPIDLPDGMNDRANAEVTAIEKTTSRRSNRGLRGILR